MQHALRVRRGQTGAQLTGDVDDLLGRQPADAPEQRGQVLALDQLHRVEDAALGLADVEDAAHRGMRDLPRQPDFVEDALAAVRRRSSGSASARPRSRARGRRRARRRPCRRGRSARSSGSGRRTPRPARTRASAAPAPVSSVVARRRGIPAATRLPARSAASSPQASARKAPRSAAGRSSAARNTSLARWCSDDIGDGRKSVLPEAGVLRAGFCQTAEDPRRRRSRGRKSAS